MRPTRFTVALAAALTLLACNDGVMGPGPVCTADFRYGLNVTVLDGSGGPAAQGSIGIAKDGSHEETLDIIGAETMAGAGERPGTYDITISKTGYMTWSAENVTVAADECHVIPVSLQANLIPVS
jgi:hypothetical protein